MGKEDRSVRACECAYRCVVSTRAQGVQVEERVYDWRLPVSVCLLRTGDYGCREVCVLCVGG